MGKRILLEVTNPFGDKFKESWNLWKQYKVEAFKFTYKSAISEQSAINSLVKMSGGKEDVAIQIINQSFENQWEGFWPLKDKSNGKQTVNTDTERQSLNDAINKRFGRV